MRARRTAKWAGVALLLAAVVAGAVMLLASPDEAIRPGPAPAAAQLLDGAALVGVDVPPRRDARLVAASGWPFAELPEVVKFVAAPTPEVGVPFTSPSLYREPVILRLAGSAMTYAERTAVTPWLLLPAAVGVIVLADSDDDDGEDDDFPPPPPPSVVPEPSTYLLLGTGLLILGVAARIGRA